LAAIAVKVTALPEQTGFSETAIETLTGVLWFLIINIGLDVTGLGEAHPRVEVILHVI
jgi:hypothetical protein